MLLPGFDLAPPVPQHAQHLGDARHAPAKHLFALLKGIQLLPCQGLIAKFRAPRGQPGLKIAHESLGLAQVGVKILAPVLDALNALGNEAAHIVKLGVVLRVGKFVPLPP